MTGTWDGRTSKPLGLATSTNTQKSLDDLFDDDFEEEFTSFLEQEASQFDVVHRSAGSAVVNRHRQQSYNDSGYPSDGVSKCSSKAIAKLSSATLSPLSAHNESHSNNVGEPVAVSTPCAGPASAHGARRLTSQTTPLSSTGRSGSTRKRQFPGPAGILPNTAHRDSDVSGFLNTSSDALDRETTWPPTPRVSLVPRPGSGSVPCSQPSGSPCSYSDALWQRMMQELQIREEDLRKHSIESIKRAAARKKLKGGKVPFLAAIIDSVSVAIADASILLKDPTGDMHGTMLKQLIKDYPTQLHTGSLLLLRQVAVFSPSPRRQYLNITPNNVLCIYNESDDLKCTAVTTVAQYSLEDGLDVGESSLKQAVNEAVACASFVPAVHVQPTGRLLQTAVPVRFAAGCTPESPVIGKRPMALSANGSVGRFGGGEQAGGGRGAAAAGVSSSCSIISSRSSSSRPTDCRLANTENSFPAAAAAGRPAPDPSNRLAYVTDSRRPICDGASSSRVNVLSTYEPAKPTASRPSVATAVYQPARITPVQCRAANATSATSRAVQQAVDRNPPNASAAAVAESGWLDCDWDDLDLELPP